MELEPPESQATETFLLSMPANPEDPNTGLGRSRRTQHSLPLWRRRDVCGWPCPVSEASWLSVTLLRDNVWPPCPSCSQREILSINTSAKTLPDIFRVCSGGVVSYDNPVWVFQLPGEQSKKMQCTLLKAWDLLRKSDGKLHRVLWKPSPLLPPFLTPSPAPSVS